MRSALFVLFARLGDVCCGIPTFRALAKKYPEAKLYWLTLPKYFELVPEFGVPVSIPSPEPFGRPPDLTAAFDLVYHAQPMWRHEEWKASGKHVIDLIASWCDVSLADRKIQVDVPVAVVERVARMPLPNRFLTIGCSPTISSRNLLPEHFPSIVEFCRLNKIPYAAVGGDDGVSIPGAIDFRGHLSPVESIALINRSAVYVGPDSGTSWLACAAQNPKKVCVLDRERMKDGMVGFQGFADGAITDVFYQDGLNALIGAVENAWRAE